jgi:NADPH-dependent curcumin reductase CurA
VTEPLVSELKPGQILVKLAFLSVDPYMRMRLNAHPLNTPMVGGSAGYVIKSASEKFPVGSAVLSHFAFAWKEYQVAQDKDVYPVPKEWPLSLTLGALGMPGATAYLGLLHVCRPVAGETIFVTGAAGAVGSLVGQIGKQLGCTVIGSAGGAAKCEWVKELGLDDVIDYQNKTYAQLLQEVKQASPHGIDCFFENTGGPISDAVVENMNKHGRVAICGLISTYNEHESRGGLLFPQSGIYKEIKFEAFIGSTFSKQWPEAHHKIFEWIQQKKVVAREEIVHGFDHVIDAFLGLFSGKNTGKMVVQL